MIRTFGSAYVTARVASVIFYILGLFIRQDIITERFFRPTTYMLSFTAAVILIYYSCKYVDSSSVFEDMIIFYLTYVTSLLVMVSVLLTFIDQSYSIIRVIVLGMAFTLTLIPGEKRTKRFYKEYENERKK